MRTKSCYSTVPHLALGSIGTAGRDCRIVPLVRAVLTKKADGNDSYFNSINRTMDSYKAEVAGQQSQDEDRSRPENSRVGLIKGNR